jgi:hypothetical protein
LPAQYRTNLPDCAPQLAAFLTAFALERTATLARLPIDYGERRFFFASWHRCASLAI